jgi:hypothetical protein
VLRISFCKRGDGARLTKRIEWKAEETIHCREAESRSVRLDTTGSLVVGEDLAGREESLGLGGLMGSSLLIQTQLPSNSGLECLRLRTRKRALPPRHHPRRSLAG